jgi:hypothetical protein
LPYLDGESIGAEGGRLVPVGRREFYMSDSTGLGEKYVARIEPVQLLLKALGLSLLTEVLLISGASLHPVTATIVSALHWPSTTLSISIVSTLYGDRFEGPELFPMIVLLNVPIAIVIWQVAWLILLKVGRMTVHLSCNEHLA